MPTYNRLTCEQRYTIEAMHRNGCEQKQIAGAIGKHPSTVSRELRRLTTAASGVVAVGSRWNPTPESV